MENIDIKLVLDEVFGTSCNTIACNTCKYKEDCELINKFINDFGKTQEDIIKLATENGFELDWIINRWNSIIEDKDILKPINAVFPKYAEDMIINIVNANIEINHFIDTSNAEYKEMIKMVNQSADNNKQENKFKNVRDDEIYAELKRRKANKSAK